MPVIPVARADVTSEEVGEILRRGLGPGYNILPATQLHWTVFGRPRPDRPDRMVVGTGSNRVFRVQVTIVRDGAETRLAVNPGGLSPVLVLINRVWIAERVRWILQSTVGVR